MVPAAGLEPARPTKPRDFKSLVSTIPPRGQMFIGSDTYVNSCVRDSHGLLCQSTQDIVPACIICVLMCDKMCPSIRGDAWTTPPFSDVYNQPMPMMGLFSPDTGRIGIEVVEIDTSSNAVIRIFHNIAHNVLVWRTKITITIIDHCLIPNNQSQ